MHMVVRVGAEVRVEHGLGRSGLLVDRVSCTTYGEADEGHCLVLNTSIDCDRLVGTSEGTK